MITSLRIRNFRCFHDIDVTGLAPITLFGGKNNSGKSAILEAVFLHFGYRNPNIFLALAVGRNGNGDFQAMPERVWDPLFFGFDKVRELSLAVSREDGIASELSLAKVTDQNASLDLNAGSVTAILRQGYDPRFLDRHFYALHYTHTVGEGKTQGQFSFEGRQIRHATLSTEGRGQDVLVKVNLYKSVYMVDNSTLAEWVSKFILDGKKSDLLGVLQIFDPRIVDLTTLVENNISYIYVILSDKMRMPITYMGDGINKILQLLLLILTSPNGIVLLDEIENGFHYSVYDRVLRLLYEAALRVHCQLLITTHNIDILRQSAQVMKEMERLQSLCYERIGITANGRKAYRFSGEELETALDAELEVR